MNEWDRFLCLAHQRANTTIARPHTPTLPQTIKQFLEPLVAKSDLPVHFLAGSLTLWIILISLLRAHTFTLFSLCVFCFCFACCGAGILTPCAYCLFFWRCLFIGRFICRSPSSSVGRPIWACVGPELPTYRPCFSTHTTKSLQWHDSHPPRLTN